MATRERKKNKTDSEKRGKILLTRNEKKILHNPNTTFLLNRDLILCKVVIASIARTFTHKKADTSGAQHPGTRHNNIYCFMWANSYTENVTVSELSTSVHLKTNSANTESERKLHIKQVNNRKLVSFSLSFSRLHSARHPKIKKHFWHYPAPPQYNKCT